MIIWYTNAYWNDYWSQANHHIIAYNDFVWGEYLKSTLSENF